MSKLFASVKAVNTAANNFASYLLPPPDDEDNKSDDDEIRESINKNNNNNNSIAMATLKDKAITPTIDNSLVKYGDENAQPGGDGGPLSPATAYSLRSDLDLLSLPPPVPMARPPPPPRTKAQTEHQKQHQQRATSNKATNDIPQSRGKNRGVAEPMTTLENGANTRNNNTKSQTKSKIQSPSLVLQRLQQPKKMRSPSPNDARQKHTTKNSKETSTANRTPPRPATMSSLSPLKEVNRIPPGFTLPPLAPFSGGKTKKVMMRRRFSKSGNEHENNENDDDDASVESSNSHRSTASSSRARGRGWGRSYSRSQKQKRRASYSAESVLTATTAKTRSSKTGPLPSKPKFSSVSSIYFMRCMQAPANDGPC
jgi:hypothetical protein